MAKFRLNRRTLLRGAGSIAIALPWLEAMGTEKPAHGAAAPAQRFLAVYTPGGTVRAKYTPTGTETAPVLSPILKPLQPIMDLKKLVIIDGLDMKSAIGEHSKRQSDLHRPTQRSHLESARHCARRLGAYIDR